MTSNTDQDVDLVDAKGPLPPDAVQRLRLAGLAVFAVVCALLVLGQGRDGGPFATATFDFYQRTAPRDSSNDHVRIISIDEASLAEFGSWPWPRHYLAVLLDNAVAGGASAVGFDMVFPEPDRHGAQRLQQIYGHLPDEILEPLSNLPEPDHHFASRLARTPSVVARVGLATDVPGSHPEPNSLILNANIKGHHAGVPHHPGVLANVEVLDSAAAGHGLLNGAPDEDGVVRRVPLLGRVGDTLTPSFALELIRVAKEHDAIHRSATGKHILVGDHEVKTDDQAHLRIHAAHLDPSNYVSAADVLAGRVPEGMFQDKIVIIAAGAVGLGDVVATPLSGETFGVDLHAQAIEMMLNGEWLERPTWAPSLEWLMLVTSVLMLIFWGPRLSVRRTGLGLLCIIAVCATAGWLFFSEARLLLDPMLPVSGLIVTAMVLFGAFSVETERRQKVLQEQLQHARLEQARVTGELNAAREIQLGILPDAETVSALPDGIETAALLEPAREIGGDLYDIFMLDDHRLFFLVGDVTGKGVPAALFMSISKVLTKSAVTRTAEALEEAVCQANLDISRENPASLFVTALAGVLDCQTGDLIVVNAGHDDPLRLTAEGGLENMTCDGGPPLCVMEDFPYMADTFTLNPGETIIIVTDGVTEARAPDGELFGGERLKQLLSDQSVQLSPRSRIDSIRDHVRTFEQGRDATDDLTVMAIRRLANA